jgi:general secretion pathway protein A
LYGDYWGFKEKPFENTPDPRFFYYSSKHQEGLARLLYVVNERKGSALLSGEYGSGKTLLSRVLVNKLLNEEDMYNIALIVNPAIPLLEFLGEIVYQLGGEVSREDRKVDILHVLNDKLYKTAQGNRHTVIIIDEAQAAEDLIFEEVRLLLNFQLNDRFLFTLLLLGQPELKDKIEKFPQLKQRLAIRYHLIHLDAQETKDYIQHRCRIAGREEPIFSEDSYRLIYDYSQGVPRQINNICDMSLVIGVGEKVKLIDERIIKEVISDFQQGQEIIKETDKNPVV